MRIRAIAFHTFGAFLRNKLLFLFCAIFLIVLLLFSTPILMTRKIGQTMSAVQAQGAMLGMLSLVVSLVSGFGSLLAAWATADTVGSELRSGTILAVLARPVRRWEFLLGKYLGAQLLMAIYIAFVLASTYFFAWLVGERIQSSIAPLIVYPMVRYAIYSSIALWLVTMMHPFLAVGVTVVISTVANMVTPSSRSFSYLPHWLVKAVYDVLPSVDLLSEARFLAITQASLKPVPFSEHLTALAYGLDCALVLFLLAAWRFGRLNLTRE